MIFLPLKPPVHVHILKTTLLLPYDVLFIDCQFLKPTVSLTQELPSC
jgi:hypothetical protein